MFFLSRYADASMDIFSKSIIMSLVNFTRDEKFHDDLTLIAPDIN